MKITHKEGSGTFLLKVSDTDDNATTSEFAVVTFSQQLLEQIEVFKKIIEDLKSKGQSVYRMTAFDYSVEYFADCSYPSIENIDEDVADALYNAMTLNEGQVEIEELDTENIPMLRTECGQIMVDDFGVMFDAYVKFTNTKMWTEKISFEQLGL